jgi:hypothetical protein
MRMIILALVATASLAAVAAPASADPCNVTDPQCYVTGHIQATSPCPPGYKGVIVDTGSKEYKVCYDI